METISVLHFIRRIVSGIAITDDHCHNPSLILRDGLKNNAKLIQSKSQEKHPSLILGLPERTLIGIPDLSVAAKQIERN